MPQNETLSLDIIEYKMCLMTYFTALHGKRTQKKDKKTKKKEQFFPAAAAAASQLEENKHRRPRALKMKRAGTLNRAFQKPRCPPRARRRRRRKKREQHFQNRCVKNCTVIESVRAMSNTSSGKNTYALSWVIYTLQKWLETPPPTRTDRTKRRRERDTVVCACSGVDTLPLVMSRCHDDNCSHLKRLVKA